MINQVMVRCFPAELTEKQIKEFVDVLRVEIGPLRYARSLIEPDQNRVDTVGFISFYNLTDNVRCIRKMRHTLQLMLPHDTHYVQFKPNHDINHRAFNKKPFTLLRVYDLKDELIRFSMEYEDRNIQRDVQQEIEEETMEQIDEPITPHCCNGKNLAFLDKFYKNYIEKQSNNIVRIWEDVREKQDRYGVGYNEAEIAKNQARNEMLDELCGFDPSYNLYRSQMIDWPLFQIETEYWKAYNWHFNNRRRELNESSDEEWF